MFFHVFNECSDPPEIIDIFGFTLDPLGAEKLPVLFVILNFYGSFLTENLIFMHGTLFLCEWCDSQEWHILMVSFGSSCFAHQN